MGSKRKGNKVLKDDNNKRAKVNKSNYDISENKLTLAKRHHSNKNPPHETPVANEDIRARLSLLERIIWDITGTPESVQRHSAEAGPDVIKAAVELGKAFHARKIPPSTCENFNNTNCMPVQYKDPSPVRVKESDFVPRLPPITDSSLEKAVFTHPGVGNNDGATYDRLEILGDAYIELMATKLVWERFRELPSGRISQIRESLVKNETLSEFASKYGFDSKALVPRDYLGQPKRWIKTKGDIFEAYVAAVILSDTVNGYKVVEDWLTALWTPQITTTGAQTICLNAKEALAKKIMGKGIELRYVDEYPPIQLEGGKQTFFTGVYLTGWGWNNSHLGSGQGPNKAIAGDQAARQALQNEKLISEITSVREAYKAIQVKDNCF